MTTIAGWNAESWRGAPVGDALRDIIRRHRPEVIALSEMRGNRPAIFGARRKRYQKVITGRAGDMASTGLLVRKDIPVRRRGVLRVRARWVGPNDKPHIGRGFPYALVQLDGEWTWVVGVHMPWNARRNPAAVDACWDALTEFADSRSLPVIFVGDWNASSNGKRAERLAGSGRVIPGHNVDFAVTTSSHGFADVGPRYGSDHHAVLYTLNQGRTR